MAPLPRLRPQRRPQQRFEENVQSSIGPLRGGLASIGRGANRLFDSAAYNPIVEALGGVGDRQGLFASYRANQDRRRQTREQENAIADMFGDDPTMLGVGRAYPELAVGEGLRRESVADERAYQNDRDEREYGRDIDMLRTRARLDEEARRSTLTQTPFEVIINGQKRQIIRGADGQLTDYVSGQAVDPATVGFGAAETQTQESFAEPFRHPDLGYGQFDNEGQWHAIEVENNTDAGAMGDPAARLYTAGKSIEMANEALDTSRWHNTGAMAFLRSGFGGQSKLESQLEMLKANNAFLGLAELASQGVKLTPLSNSDLVVAGNMVANLNATQGTDTLDANIRQVRSRYLNIYNQVIQGVREQYPDGNVPANVQAVVDMFEQVLAETPQDAPGGDDPMGLR